MLQHADVASETAAASLSRLTDPESNREIPARMSASRLISSEIFTNSTSLEVKVHQQHIRRPLEDAGKRGMTVYIGNDCERSKGVRRQRDFVCGESNVEWEGGIRDRKRQEIADGGEDTGIRDPQQHLSGESDLTAEHSVAFMAAESSSTRTTSSLEEDTCELKLQYSTAAPAICTRYNGVDHPDDGDDDDEDDDPKSHFEITHNVSCFDQAHNAMQAKLRSDDQHEEDWLELRLGSKFSSICDATASSSPSLSTLQLLPQKPDCAAMKERELKKVWSDIRQINVEQELIMKLSPIKVPFSHNHDGATVQNARDSQERFTQELSYSSLLQPPTSFPTPPSDSIGQCIAGPSALYAGANEIYSKFPPIFHLHQQQQPMLRHILPRTSATPHDQRSSSLSPLRQSSHAANWIPRSSIDFRNESWQHLVAASPNRVQQPTSFQDLISSTFLRDLNGKCTLDNPLSTPIQHPLNKAMDDNWPSRLHQASSTDDKIPLNMMAMELDPFHTRSVSRSMTSWLSQAIAGGPDQIPELSNPPLMKQRQGKLGATERLVKCITKPRLRGIPGFWFALQPAETRCYDAEIRVPDILSKSYIRIKDGDIPVSAVKKYLLAKLSLSSESQVDLTCRGKSLAENTSLKNVRDEIWLPADFAGKETFTFRSEGSSTTLLNECVMMLTYEISQS